MGVSKGPVLHSFPFPFITFGAPAFRFCVRLRRSLGRSPHLASSRAVTNGYLMCAVLGASARYGSGPSVRHILILLREPPHSSHPSSALCAEFWSPGTIPGLYEPSTRTAPRATLSSRFEEARSSQGRRHGRVPAGSRLGSFPRFSFGRSTP